MVEHEAKLLARGEFVNREFLWAWKLLRHFASHVDHRHHEGKNDRQEKREPRPRVSRPGFHCLHSLSFTARESHVSRERVNLARSRPDFSLARLAIQ
jgi:hypothetical protein